MWREVTVLATLMTLAPSADEKYLPDNLVDAKMLVCGIGGNVDGSSDSLVVVEFQHGVAYRALIARRPDPIAAANDCINWLRGFQQRWQELHERKH